MSIFENIGKSIKFLAKISFWVGIGTTIIVGIISIGLTGLLGLVSTAAFLFYSLLFPFVLYGFGELIEKVSEIAKWRIPEVQKHKGASNISTKTNDDDSLPQKTNAEIKFLRYIKDDVCGCCHHRYTDEEYKIKDVTGERIVPICWQCYCELTQNNDQQ